MIAAVHTRANCWLLYSNGVSSYQSNGPTLSVINIIACIDEMRSRATLPGRDQAERDSIERNPCSPDTCAHLERASTLRFLLHPLLSAAFSRNICPVSLSRFRSRDYRSAAKWQVDATFTSKAAASV